MTNPTPDPATLRVVSLLGGGVEDYLSLEYLDAIDAGDRERIAEVRQLAARLGLSGSLNTFLDGLIDEAQAGAKADG